MFDPVMITATRDEAKRIIALGQAAERLSKNKDFKALILDHYFEKEPARLVSLISEPSMASSRQAIIESMQAIGTLRSFLREVVTMGQGAAQELKDFEEMLEAEEAEEAQG